MAAAFSPRVIAFGTGASDAEPAPDVASVGAKGHGLIDMARAGLPVPPGFVLPIDLCRSYAEEGWSDEHDVALTAGIRGLEAATGLGLGDPARPLLVSVRSGAPVSMPGMLDSILNVGMTDEVEASLAQLSGDRIFAIDTHRRFLEIYEAVVGTDAPSDPTDQLRGAVEAVFASYAGDRARIYCERHGLDLQYTAVTVQQMVFGNLGDDSGSGVAHSHDPISGSATITGEFLPRAQGTDIVGGTRSALALESMRDTLEDAYIDLGAALGSLQSNAHSATQVEFTVERGRLYLLQVRTVDPPARQESAATRSAAATTVVVRGTPASAGVVTGVLCTDTDDAIARAAAGESVILVRPETTPADVEALAAASGLVTVVGGMTSHAAVVARAWGTPAVVGCSDIGWRPDGIVLDGDHVPAGAAVTVDGTAGTVSIEN